MVGQIAYGVCMFTQSSKNLTATSDNPAAEKLAGIVPDYHIG